MKATYQAGFGPHQVLWRSTKLPWSTSKSASWILEF